ncbi:hemerythrin HHE cation binding domain-containing protein [Ahrensia sp. R2A130]|nr:hemerythrin HHE cation binding domain-containing protein [Ahrensia sp. R2A130]
MSTGFSKDYVEVEPVVLGELHLRPTIRFPSSQLENPSIGCRLFPLLEQRAGRESVAKGIERLRYEHWEDEDYAEEISQTLGLLGRGEPVGSVDKVSWLLRGFFSGVRRHIAYETDQFLPMLDAEAMSQAPA